MAYHEQSWSSRFQSMGDEAEGIFEKVWPYKWERRGFNRPEVSMKLWSPFVRYEPDYIDRYGFIECQGFGNDRLIKIKDDKRIALMEWQEKQLVRMFFWDRTKKRWCDISLERVLELLDKSGYYGEYHEGNKWCAIHADNDLSEVEWHDYEAG